MNEGPVVGTLSRRGTAWAYLAFFGLKSAGVV